MLRKISTVKARKEHYVGCRHRMYRVVDPRYDYIQEILKKLKDEVSRDTFLTRLRLRLTNEFFTSRNLKPNPNILSCFAHKLMYVNYRLMWVRANAIV